MPEYSIGRLKGRFVVTWADSGTRHRYRLKALNAKDAEREALDLIRRKTLPTESVTVADLWQAYREHLGDRPAAKTLGYTGLAVLQHFGHLRPAQITIQNSRDYTAARLKAGRKKGAVWTELGHLRSCLIWAQKIGSIDRAPFIERPQKPAPKERYLTHAEIDRLIAADCAPHIRIAILLLLTTAGRVGAILDLTWDRVDFERAQINLRVDQEGPRKGRAVVPMNNTLRAALIVAREGALTDYVVEWAGGRVASIRKGFEAAAGRAGLAGVSPHVIRHTAGVHMAASGVPMMRISQFMGHSNTATTERVYARFAPDHLADAAAALDFGKLRTVQ